MGERENIETVRRFYASGRRNATTNVSTSSRRTRSGLSRARTPFSADFRGVESIATDIGARMQPLDSWKIEPRHVMTNGNHVVAVVHVGATAADTRSPCTALTCSV